MSKEYIAYYIKTIWQVEKMASREMKDKILEPSTDLSYIILYEFIIEMATRLVSRKHIERIRYTKLLQKKKKERVWVITAITLELWERRIGERDEDRNTYWRLMECVAIDEEEQKLGPETNRSTLTVFMALFVFIFIFIFIFLFRVNCLLLPTLYVASLLRNTCTSRIALFFFCFFVFLLNAEFPPSFANQPKRWSQVKDT